MKREIKFRAWIPTGIGQGDMVSPYTLQQAIYSKKSTFPMAMLNRIVFMLYTGLKDKNGREIYENDLLQCTSYTYGNGETDKTSLLVKYDEMSAGFIAGPYMLGKLMDIRKCEVIGNIFENKELLEEKQ